MKVRYERIVNAPVEKVLEAYRSTDFYAEKQKSSGAIEVEIVETEEQSSTTFRMKAKCSEPSRLPSFLRQSDVDTYVDDTLLDTHARTMTWKITPSVGADKFFLSGLVEFHEQEASTKVVYNVELKVKIPLVGSKAEKLGLAKTEEETDKQAAFLSNWVASH